MLVKVHCPPSPDGCSLNTHPRLLKTVCSPPVLELLLLRLLELAPQLLYPIVVTWGQFVAAADKGRGGKKGKNVVKVCEAKHSSNAIRHRDDRTRASFLIYCHANQAK